MDGHWDLVLSNDPRTAQHFQETETAGQEVPSHLRQPLHGPGEASTQSRRPLAPFAADIPGLCPIVRGSCLQPLRLSMDTQRSCSPLPTDASNSTTVDPKPFGYVGLEWVIDQLRIKTMRSGVEFNIMVVGQHGLGKSTLVNTLFKSKVSCKSSCPASEVHNIKTVQVRSVTHVIEENGVKMTLTVTDAPGFGDQINNQNCWEPIIEYINDQYERYLQEELAINRKKTIPDTRVHVCLYFVPPTGHRLRPLDMEFLKRVHRITNVVPVIAKADSLTVEEREQFRQRIQQDLKAFDIHVYPQEELDTESDDLLLNSRIREKIPFAVVGADGEHQVNGDVVLGRKTKCGIIEVENPQHCEFYLLRDLLIRSHLQDLKLITHKVHYEQYRMNRLTQGNPKAQARTPLSPVERDPEITFEQRGPHCLSPGKGVGLGI